MEIDGEGGTIRVLGKGNKERRVHATNGGALAIGDWIAVLCRVFQTGVVSPTAGMTPAVLRLRLERRCKQANVHPCSPARPPALVRLQASAPTAASPTTTA